MSFSLGGGGMCREYRTKGKRWLKTNGKYYFVDPGLRNALLGSRSFDHGHDLENMVHLELRRREPRAT
ncbi:ATP-binding protein [Corynebacterium pilosum]|nr:ATP-binding protein [Corynebacterium pilosum]